MDDKIRIIEYRYTHLGRLDSFSLKVAHGIDSAFLTGPVNCCAEYLGSYSAVQ